MNWQLTLLQKDLFDLTVAEKDVIDLGAGNGSLAVEAINAGARKVTALESREEPGQKKHPNLRWVHQTFREAPVEIHQTAIIAWPWEGTQTEYLLRHALACHEILVIAQNTGGTSCGNARLWKELSNLHVENCIPDPRNTLVLYRNRPRKKPHHCANTPVLRLEAAGMDVLTIHPYHPDIWAPEPGAPEP